MSSSSKSPSIDPELVSRLKSCLRRGRLIETVTRLVAVPSRTGEAGGALDCLAEILANEGFHVERPVADHPVAPAVVVRLESGKPGRTLQFNSHIDVVHLPYVPPAVDGDHITGSGSCDMKGGAAAAVEALRILRESGAFQAGSVLLTAHDLHEAPWGFGAQLNAMIRDGIVGDAVLIPEYLNQCLPTVGRGSATWKATVRRKGPPIHEVYRPLDEPSVIDAGAELVLRLRHLAAELGKKADPQAGSDSVFIGQIHSGEIFNQYPQECWLEGTRRWLPGTNRDQVEREFRDIVSQVAQKTGATIDLQFQIIRDAFKLDVNDPLVTTFQQVYTATSGKTLPLGGKTFVDDGNSFWGLAGVPAITHGPNAGGAHTVEEWVSIEDLMRVSLLYALTAVLYCAEPKGS